MGAQSCCWLLPQSCQDELPTSGLQQYHGHLWQLGAHSPRCTDLPPSPPRLHQLLGLAGRASPLGLSLGYSLGPQQHSGLSHWMGKQQSLGGSRMLSGVPAVTLRCEPTLGASAVLWVLQLGEQSYTHTGLPGGQRMLTYLHHLPGGSPSTFRCVAAWVSQAS